MTKLVIGCGYLGHRVARKWLQQGESVVVVTRSDERAEALRVEGFQPVVADVSDPESLKCLPEARTVLHSVGYDRRAAASRRAVVVDGLRNVLDSLSQVVDRLVFISSTGVMGCHRGSWVDETAFCEPQREAGRCGLEAEKLLQAHRLGRRTVILRLAGLYGSGRLPKLADLRAGHPLAAPDGAHLNLIHVEDAAEAVLAVERMATPPDLYLVSDGCPTGHRAFYSEMARQLGLPSPIFTDPVPGSRGAAAALGNKRVDNGRMLGELQVELQFPSFREGLAAICSELRDSGETG
ncbi:MAG: SDR family oxidoreductase [bacterium]|nr:SDR family oxidoreductase [bacterium]